MSLNWRAVKDDSSIAPQIPTESEWVPEDTTHEGEPHGELVSHFYTPDRLVFSRRANTAWLTREVSRFVLRIAIYLHHFTGTPGLDQRLRRA